MSNSTASCDIPAGAPTETRRNFWTRSRLRDYDLTSLSLFRIALAWYIFVYTQVGTFPRYEDLYTDRGVLPRWLLLRCWTGTGRGW